MLVVFENILQRSEKLARVQAHRAALRFVNGVDWLIRDTKSVVGRTQFDVIYERDKLQVRRYRLGTAKPEFPVPVLLVPPLMVKPFIFDLYPNRSLVASLLRRGFAVYLVDFGEPDRADAYVTLEHYVLDWIPAAVEAVKHDAGAKDISLVGYCMGALFALSYTAAHKDDSVRNIVSIGAPVDFEKMGLLAWVAKHGGDQLESLAEQVGNIPGNLSSLGFRLLSPMKNVTRYGDLFMNLWSDEYVNGFDAMNQWVGQFIDYPQGAFLQFYKEFVRNNKMVKGELRFGDRSADLKDVHAAILAFAGEGDQVAPLASAKAIVDAVGSQDITFLAVPGGHMGVFAGGSAPDTVWKPTAEWLAPRSRARRKAAPQAQPKAKAGTRQGARKSATKKPSTKATKKKRSTGRR